MTLEAKAMEAASAAIFWKPLWRPEKGTGKASSLSWVEIAVALKEVMQPEDRLVLSKTHGHLALDALWENPEYPMWPGWPHKCSGSLGQGLGMAAGMALANKARTDYLPASSVCWAMQNYMRARSGKR